MNAAPYEIIDGIKCFAPGLARSCVDYPMEVFEKLARIEEKHFWFRSRNAVIRNLVRKHLVNPAAERRFLEIGCGTGYVLKMLSTMPDLDCTGAEIHLEGAQISKARVPAAEIIQLDATNIPFRDEFDGVGAFDVIEHIEADETVMQNVHQALKPGGCFFITVLQHDFLWSYQDDFSAHKRRYSREDLVAKLKRCGFQIEFVGSFCSLLLPLMLLVRLTKGRPDDNADGMARVLAEFEISPTLNKILRTLMRPDEWLIAHGCSMPFGGSLTAVARKPGTV